MDADDVELQARVDALYSGYRRPNLHTIDGTSATEQFGGAAGVYGEVTSPESIFKVLKLGSDDHFIDLGSGRGQVVLAACMRQQDEMPHNGRPATATGIEMVPPRHADGKSALAQASDNVRACVTLVCGDALKEDLRRATKVFICNATFPGALNASFAAALTPDRAPDLQRVATIAPLPEADLAKNSLQLSCITTATASWAIDGCPLHVYSRTGTEPPPDSVIDYSGIERMLARRREGDRIAHERAARGELGTGVTAGEVERGAMRTALLAAAFE